MGRVMIESSAAVRAWLDSALVGASYTGFGYESAMHLQAPEVTQIGAAWDRFTPPELYLQARAPRVQPHVSRAVHVEHYPLG